MASFFSQFAQRGPLFAVALVGAGAGGLVLSSKKMREEGKGQGWWGKGVKILPHGELEQISGNVWQVTAEMHPWIPLSKFFLNWDRNMTVFRPPSPSSPSFSPPAASPFQIGEDDLIIHNAVAMNEEEMEKLESLGTPAVLIVPKISHMRDAMFYKERYPNIVVVCPSEIIDFVNNEVPVDHPAEDVFPSLGVKWYAPPLMTRYAELILEIPLEGELPSSSSTSSDEPPSSPSALLFCDFMISKMRASALVMWFASLYGVDMRLPQPQRSKLFDSISYGTTQTMQQWTEATSSNWEQVNLLLFTHGSPLRFQHNPFLQKKKQASEVAHALALERGGELEEGDRV